MVVAFPGRIRAFGWIWGTMVHKTLPEAPIHPVIFGPGRLMMHACIPDPVSFTASAADRWIA
jgi:hypothetical protein